MRDNSRILYVLNYLQEQSDEQHPVSIKRIVEYLETLGITAYHSKTATDLS